MNRIQAQALIMYLNKCIGIIPTTGMEWGTIASLLPTLEAVANGQLELVPKEPPKGDPP